MYISIVFFINTLNEEYYHECKIKVPEGMTGTTAANLLCFYSYLNHVNVNLSNPSTSQDFLYVVVNEKDPKQVIVSMLDSSGNEDEISTNVSVIIKYMKEFLHVYNNSKMISTPGRNTPLNIFNAELITDVEDNPVLDNKIKTYPLFFSNFSEAEDIEDTKVKFGIPETEYLIVNNGFGKEVVAYLNNNKLLDPEDECMVIDSILMLEDIDSITMKIFLDRKYHERYKDNLLRAVGAVLNRLENNSYSTYFRKTLLEMERGRVNKVKVSKLI